MLIETQAHPLDLPNRIREILANTDLSDPADIARELLRTMPPEALREVVETLLPSYVRSRMGAERALTTPANAQRVLVRSAKVDGIHEWWRKVLDDRVSVPSNGYKRLGDCTQLDLKLMAESLRDRADVMAAKARRYEQLMEHLSALHKPDAKVSDLPVPTLKEWVGTLPNGATGIGDEI